MATYSLHVKRHYVAGSVHIHTRQETARVMALTSVQSAQDPIGHQTSNARATHNIRDTGLQRSRQLELNKSRWLRASQQLRPSQRPRTRQPNLSQPRMSQWRKQNLANVRQAKGPPLQHRQTKAGTMEPAKRPRTSQIYSTGNGRTVSVCKPRHRPPLIHSTQTVAGDNAYTLPGRQTPQTFIQSHAMGEYWSTGKTDPSPLL